MNTNPNQGNDPNQQFGQFPAQPPQGQPSQQFSQYPGPQQFQQGPQLGQGLAIASMVLGIIALCLVCFWPISLILSILAITFGAIHLKKVSGMAVQPGKGMAIAGLVCGLIVPALAAILFFTVLSASQEIVTELEELQEQNLEGIRSFEE